MSLDPLSDWTARLLAMPQVDTPLLGATNLADFYGDLADKVEADSPDGSSVGIFTFDRITFATTLVGLGFGPDASTAWAGKIATAYSTALATSVITPGTVTSAAWTLSTVDTLTAPTGAATITSIAAAAASLETDLIASNALFQAGTITTPSEADSSIEDFANAFRKATLLFEFLCIGIAAGAPPTPVPLTFPAK